MTNLLNFARPESVLAFGADLDQCWGDEDAFWDDRGVNRDGMRGNDYDYLDKEWEAEMADAVAESEWHKWDVIYDELENS